MKTLLVNLISNDRAQLSKAIAIGILAGVGFGFTPTYAAIFTSPTSLDQLLVGTGNQFQVEDKLFSNFFYASAGDAQPINPVDVTISRHPSSTEQGIMITGAFFSDSPNGDLAVGYTVEVLDPDLSIVTAQLGLHGISSGEIVIVEDLISGGNQIGSMIVNNASPIDRVAFAPVQSINVLKNIELRSENGIPDAFSITTQLFSPTRTPVTPTIVTPVPEPKTLFGLLTIGGLGLLTTKRNQAS